jgi:hypothetical protein
MKRFGIVLLLFGALMQLQAQDELLAELENESDASSDYELPAFKAMKIVNLQSTKVASKGEWIMYVSHRFGTISDGFETFFGLDNANTNLQMVYAPINGLQIGLSRESIRKTYAGHIKARLMQQGKKFPLHVVAYSTINVNSQLKESQYPHLLFEDRLSYATQLLLARRVNKWLSLEMAPTYIRQNLVLEKEQEHNQYALAIGGRARLTRRLSINADYSYLFNRYADSKFKNPLSIGLDLETGGHVFQLLFSNAQSTNEPGFMTNAEGDWSKGEIYFGFNIVRTF